MRTVIGPGSSGEVSGRILVCDDDRSFISMDRDEVDQIIATTPQIVIGCCSESAVQRLRCERPGFWHTRLYSALSSIRMVDGSGLVVVVGAGTTDLALCRAVAGVCQTLGSNVELVSDVGVAGLHRLLALEECLSRARVVVVCAGMEGALAGMVLDIWPGPVVFVPNDQGIGVASGGAAAFASGLALSGGGLACCLPGDAIGAALIASRINLGRQG